MINGMEHWNDLLVKFSSGIPFLIASYITWLQRLIYSNAAFCLCPTHVKAFAYIVE